MPKIRSFMRWVKCVCGNGLYAVPVGTIVRGKLIV